MRDLIATSDCLPHAALHAPVAPSTQKIPCCCCRCSALLCSALLLLIAAADGHGAVTHPSQTCPTRYGPAVSPMASRLSAEDGADAAAPHTKGHDTQDEFMPPCPTLLAIRPRRAQPVTSVSLLDTPSRDNHHPTSCKNVSHPMQRHDYAASSRNHQAKTWTRLAPSIRPTDATVGAMLEKFLPFNCAAVEPIK